MDLLAEMTGAGIPRTIGGKEWRLMPLRLVDWAEAANILNGRRKSPLEIVTPHLSKLDKESKQHLLELAFREERDGDLLNQYDVRRWFLTEEGGVWRFWAQIRQQHPEVTLGMAEQLVRIAGTELEATMQKLEGHPEGNSSGPTQTSQASQPSVSLGDKPSNT